MSDELKIAIEAAKKGAENAIKYFYKGIDSSVKDDGTVLTHADTETEEVIKDFISAKFKNAKFVGEEYGGNIKEKEFWCIDPIDGTRSYARGIPTWCTIVSLCRDDDVYLSVVYFPHIDTIYYGQRGLGAFENNKKLHVSSISNIKDAFLGFGSPRHIKDPNSFWRLVKATAGSRSWDPTYTGCLLAAGKVDIHIDEWGKIWDLAPFKVMVEEAGGKITRLDGSPWNFEGSGAIISNGILHDKALSIFNVK